MMTEEELKAIERKYVLDFADAANLISEVRELKAALDEIANMHNVGDDWLDVVLEMKHIASAALKGGE